MIKEKEILLIDDSYESIRLMEYFVKAINFNYNLLSASSGKLAFEILDKVSPNLILLDWQMPEMSGLEVLKKLKANSETKKIPVIIVTGVMTGSSNLFEAFENGAEDFIRKPIDSLEFTARIQSVLKMQEYHNQIILNKNKELAENTLLLIRNNKFNIAVTKQLQKLRRKIIEADEEVNEIFRQIIIEIDEKIKQDSWQRFELSFKSTNADFKKKLLEKFPKLTISELKLCIFLKIGMNTKDIAAVMYQNYGSIKVARSRLRKKLQLASDQNLQLFLSSL